MTKREPTYVLSVTAVLGHEAAHRLAEHLTRYRERTGETVGVVVEDGRCEWAYLEWAYLTREPEKKERAR